MTIVNNQKQNSSQSTQNLGLSHFNNNDTPKWLQDYNDDMERIDNHAGSVASTSTLGHYQLPSGGTATNLMSGSGASVITPATNPTSDSSIPLTAGGAFSALGGIYAGASFPNFASPYTTHSFFASVSGYKTFMITASDSTYNGRYVLYFDTAIGAASGGFFVFINLQRIADINSWSSIAPIPGGSIKCRFNSTGSQFQVETVGASIYLSELRRIN